MELKGSCLCKAVTFTVMSQTPAPYQWCHCEGCRKTAGSVPNIMGLKDTLSVKSGNDVLKEYHRTLEGKKSSHGRSFCSMCGTHLWAFDPSYPKWCYPVASAIDTPDLPVPPQQVHIMTEFNKRWFPCHETVTSGKGDGHDTDNGTLIFDRYPDESIEEYHKRHKQFLHLEDS